MTGDMIGLVGMNINNTDSPPQVRTLLNFVFLIKGS